MPIHTRAIHAILYAELAWVIPTATRCLSQKALFTSLPCSKWWYFILHPSTNDFVKYAFVWCFAITANLFCNKSQSVLQLT